MAGIATFPVMMAFAMMAAIRHQANQSIPKKNRSAPGKTRRALIRGRSRKSVE